jgi:O-methyltransferase
MDVDLASSSQDEMTILGRLPRKSCVFSHECSSFNFSDGSISPNGGSDDVVLAIVEAFKNDNRAITGRYLAGKTGAFWDKNASWPVLPTEAVLRLIRIG